MATVYKRSGLTRFLLTRWNAPANAIAGHAKQVHKNRSKAISIKNIANSKYTFRWSRIREAGQ
jgi:hypothetical protein